MKKILRRLEMAAADKELLEQLEMEEMAIREYENSLGKLEKKLQQKEKIIEENAHALVEKDKALVEKEKTHPGFTQTPGIDLGPIMNATKIRNPKFEIRNKSK